MSNKFHSNSNFMLTIDHIVLTVEDINKTISFYTDILGMNLVEFTPIELQNQDLHFNLAIRK